MPFVRGLKGTRGIHSVGCRVFQFRDAWMLNGLQKLISPNGQGMGRCNLGRGRVNADGTHSHVKGDDYDPAQAVVPFKTA